MAGTPTGVTDVADVGKSAAGTIAALRRRRPTNPFLRGSCVAFVALAAWAWLGGTFDFGDFGTERSSRNLERFLHDVRPYPLRDTDWNAQAYVGWLGDTLGGDAVSASISTLALSIAAIVLAGAAASLLAWPAVRNWATAEPFLPEPRRPRRIVRVAWSLVPTVTRGLLIFVRAVPEYVWAFLFLPLLGLGPWPPVLALAVHNSGILGRLGAEVYENADHRAARLLRGVGASRAQIAFAALAPANLGRNLLYFFYRWETCVREATVLGLLGFVSLGWHVQQARASARYDELVLWIALGSVLILVGDAVSHAVRRFLRAH